MAILKPARMKQVKMRNLLSFSYLDFLLPRVKIKSLIINRVMCVHAVPRCEREH